MKKNILQSILFGIIASIVSIAFLKIAIRPNNTKTNTNVMAVDYEENLIGPLPRYIEQSLSNWGFKPPETANTNKDIEDDPEDIQITEHFNLLEFKCTCDKDHSTDMSNEFIEDLELIRSEANASKVIITSGFRCIENDIAVGGYGSDGPHTLGLAADMQFLDSNGDPMNTKAISCIAQDMGIFQGIANIDETYTYIHLDIKERDTGYYLGNELYGSDSVCSDFRAYYGIDDDFIDSVTNPQTFSNREAIIYNISMSEAISDKEARKKYIWSYLINNGCSPELAAGIMANMQRESDFSFMQGEIASGDSSASSILEMTHPSLGEAYGCGWGLCQWSYGCGHAAIYNWCKSHDLSADDLDGQLSYLLATLKGTDIQTAVDQDMVYEFGYDGSGVMSYTYSVIKNYGGLDRLNTLTPSQAVVAFYDLVERGYNRSDDITKSEGYVDEIYLSYTK